MKNYSRKKSRLQNKAVIARNKNLYLYTIIKTYISGIALKGTEVKALIDSGADINNAYITFSNNEAFIINAVIAHWKNAAHNNHDKKRKRKLLLNKQEINYISRFQRERHLTVIPIKFIRINGKFKLEIAIAKRKTIHDKRERLRKKEEQRERKLDLY